MIPTLLFVLLITHSKAFSIDLSHVWNDYRELYLKDYAISDVHDKTTTFYDASAYVVKHNIEADLKNHSFWIGLNQWSHMNKSELKKIRTCVIADDYSDAQRGLHFNSTIADPPDSLDYRALNMVTPVKNQGGCGSCYAFAAVVSLEGVWAKEKKKLVELSEQNVVDCAQPDGCVAGNPEIVYDYVRGNNGIDTFDSYPYEGKVGQCRFKPENVGATCSGYISLPQNEAEILKGIYEKGPAHISVDAHQKTFTGYKSGIYDSDKCDKPIDHGMAIVGYGTDKDSNKPFWIVKNSWSTEWGEKGYMRVVRNKNMCSIATHVNIATV